MGLVIGGIDAQQAQQMCAVCGKLAVGVPTRLSGVQGQVLDDACGAGGAGAAQDNDPISERQGFIHIVGHHQNGGGERLVDGQQQVLHLQAGQCVQCAEGCV